MAELDKVSVSAKPLRQILQALIGPPHYIRELQVTMNPMISPDNPITVVLEEFNAEVEAFNAKGGSPEVVDAQQDQNSKRLHHLYNRQMRALVCADLSYETWLSRLDIEVAATQ